MATSTTIGTEAGRKQEATNYLMDEANNLSVIFATREDSRKADSPRQPLPGDSASVPLQDWIRTCNNRIATVRQHHHSAELDDSRSRLLAQFPRNLHFPIGALFDFANRLGKFDNPALGGRIGLETQSIVSGILYLQQHLSQAAPAPDAAAANALVAYSRQESESTWTCYRDLIEHCRGSHHRFEITLADGESTFLPIPTLDIRLIIQNVLFSVLKGSAASETIAVQVSNVRTAGRNSFCLEVRAPGNPLSGMLNTSLYSASRSNHTFIFEGSGIGHLIAAKLVSFLGGDIVIGPNDDGTSSVRILIPLERGRPASTISVPPAQARQGSRSGDAGANFSVLYIEDMKSHAQLVKQIFERLSDIDLTLAFTAHAGLEMAETQHPDLILLDLELPDMKGLELFRRLRANPLTRDIPVFAVSASAMPHQISQALELGIKQYLTKPFSYKELIQLLKDEQAARLRRLAQG